MSTTATNNNNTTESSASISEAEDMKMFQAARRTGRRNATGDVKEQLAQAGVNSSSEVDNIAPHFQSMSIKR